MNEKARSGRPPSRGGSVSNLFVTPAGPPSGCAFARVLPLRTGCMVGVEPTTDGVRTVALPLSYLEPTHPQNHSRGLRNRLLVGSNLEIGQEAGVRTRTAALTTQNAAVTPQSCWKRGARNPECGVSQIGSPMCSVFHNPRSAFEWGPWSDSHRRIRVYETRPVATEAQGQSNDRLRMDVSRRGGRSDPAVKSSIRNRKCHGALTWTCTCDRSVPSRVRWLLRDALEAPTD